MTRMTRIAFFVLILLIGSTLTVHAQDILKIKDLSSVKVDQMSDADILKFRNQISSSGQTMEQVQKMALSKGLPASEWEKLKNRLNALPANSNGKLFSDTKSANDRDKKNADADSLNIYDKPLPKPLIDPLIFGSELYTATAPNFEPSQNLATPVNYILGPGDQLQVAVYGVQEYSGELAVSPEGIITIPNVGPIKVAGMTIEDATTRMKTVMGNSVYTYLKTGGAKLSVTLGKIRSIKVTLIGSNRPGDFTVSSLATVYNVLYEGGGPSPFGSFREIELVRNSKVIQKIDLYKLLTRGDQSDNVHLKDNDIIRIPAYKTRVELQGQVKRPGIFEVLPGEHFSDILGYASGFTDTAYRSTVKIFQRNEKERTIQDVTAEDFGKYVPETGDVFVVNKILNRFQNRVKIMGAVFRPDAYQLSPGLRVADLIRKADGLKEDAFVSNGQIIRFQEDLSRSMVSFDVRKALAGDPANNLLLQREDEVLINSVTDLRDSFYVSIQGEVRTPGKYDYVNSLTLRDLIQQAGGFTDAAYINVEVARQIRRDTLRADDGRTSEIINIELDSTLSSSKANITLAPFDVVTIHRKAGYLLPESVTVIGEVKYPGPYVLSNRTERISDVIRRAGGFTMSAYPEGVFLKRYKTAREKQKASNVANRLKKTTTTKETTIDQLQKTDAVNAADSVSIENEIKRDFDEIPIDIAAILRSPGDVSDIILRSRDELHVPQFNSQVRVSGAVLLTTQVPYQQKSELRDYIAEAGGYAGNAWKRKAYVVYANGKASTIKHFLFFKSYPKILPGSELVVPELPQRKETSPGEVLGFASALASLAGVVIALLRL